MLALRVKFLFVGVHFKKLRNNTPTSLRAETPSLKREGRGELKRKQMINKNLKYLRTKKKISQQYLADAMGIPRTTLGDYERGKTEPNLEMLVKLADFFDLKVDELIRSNISHLDYEILRNKHMKVLAITVDRNNKENIELVDTKAEAGYLESYSDPEYIKELPKISFPNMPEGSYRGFEIRGDSMLPLEPGSIVICSYVEQLEQIKDDETYIVVSKQDGLVYKRVKVDQKNMQLVLISDNEAYLPYEIEYEEIDEVWRYYAHLSFTDAKTSLNDLIDDKLQDIQRKVTTLTKRLTES